MGGASNDSRSHPEKIPAETLEHPLVYLKLQDRRYRDLADLLLRGSKLAHLSRTEARLLYGAVCQELPFDLRFREQALLPAMGRCAEPEDEFDRLSASLSGDYRAVCLLCEPLGYRLDRLALGRGWTEVLRTNAVEFAHRVKRFVSVETSILLPLAQVRMHDADLSELAAALQASRRLMAEVGKTV